MYSTVQSSCIECLRMNFGINANVLCNDRVCKVHVPLLSEKSFVCFSIESNYEMRAMKPRTQIVFNEFSLANYVKYYLSSIHLILIGTENCIAVNCTTCTVLLWPASATAQKKLMIWLNAYGHFRLANSNSIDNKRLVLLNLS